MRKSASENTFFTFIKKNAGTVALALLLLVGVMLMMLPRTETVDERGDEERLAELCESIDGAGRCSVLLNIKDGEVVSAAVLCEGADTAEVVADVKQLVSSLYGIGYNKISVLKLSE